MKEKSIHETVGRQCLLAWLSEQNLSINEFAIMMKKHYGLAWHWIRGMRIPTIQNAMRIQKLTRGRVKALSWFPTAPAKKRKNREKQPHAGEHGNHGTHS